MLDICGEIDLVAAPSGRQDSICLVIISMAFDPDLSKYEFHRRGPCRSPMKDHVRARIDPNRNVFVPVGDASPVWQHIQRHFKAEDYFAKLIVPGASECRSYCTGMSDFVATGSRVFEPRGDRSHPRSRLYGARTFWSGVWGRRPRIRCCFWSV
jgi:hypothetical protein